MASIDKIWETILKAEDEAKAAIDKGDKEVQKIIESGREQVNKKKQDAKKQYDKKTEIEKNLSDDKIKDLQENLKSSQQRGKEKAAKQVIVKKEEIVNVLLDAVLKVEIGQK